MKPWSKRVEIYSFSGVYRPGSNGPKSTDPNQFCTYFLVPPTKTSDYFFAYRM